MLTPMTEEQAHAVGHVERMIRSPENYPLQVGTDVRALRVVLGMALRVNGLEYQLLEQQRTLANLRRATEEEAERQRLSERRLQDKLGRLRAAAESLWEGEDDD